MTSYLVGVTSNKKLAGSKSVKQHKDILENDQQTSNI
jgi:hypothetical protein